MTKKATVVAGLEGPRNVRDMADEPTWQDHPERVEIVSNLKRLMRLELQRIVDEQDCFTFWMEDANTECTQAHECDLESFCRQGWQMAQVQASHRVRAAAPQPIVEIPVIQPPSTPVAPTPATPDALTAAITSEFTQGNPRARAVYRARQSAKRTQRHKHAGSSVGKHAGYTALNRVSDECAAAFVQGLGECTPLPTDWVRNSVKDKITGSDKLYVVATKSYHSVIWQGTCVARIWTNAARVAIIDFVPDLVVAVKTYLSENPCNTAGKPEITAVEQCPANSWMKVRPCTHRVTVRTADRAEAIGRLVRTQYGVYTG